MKTQNKFSAFYAKNRHICRLLIMMAAWLVFMALSSKSHKFYKLSMFQNMAASFPEYGLMALGVMLCMITGGIDLSTVGIANVTSILMCMLMTRFVSPEGALSTGVILLVFVLAVIIGAFCGCINGFLVSRIHIPPILATLGFNELVTGVCVVITGGPAISGIRAYANVVNNKLFGVIPLQLVFFAVMAILIWFLLARTTYGKKLYLLGTSAKAAQYSGLKNNRLLVKTYMMSGICSALAGMIMLANYNSARSDYGTVYTLQAVLIVVLGGVSPAGGTGRISGICLAIALLRILESGINCFPKISSYYISLIWGGVLILAMVLNYFAENKISFKRVAKS